MTYASTASKPRGLIAILAVGALHVAGAWVVVNGLKVAFVPVDNPPPITAHNTPLPKVLPPPPPPKPSQRSEAQKEQELPSQFPLETAPREARLPADPPSSGTEFIRPEPLPQPSGTPVSQAAGARPLGNPGAWINEADYPTREALLGHGGKVGFRVEIDAAGKVAACTITASSGFTRLDEATCALVTRRARFQPARDSEGRPAGGTFSSSVRWQIPD